MVMAQPRQPVPLVAWLLVACQATTNTTEVDTTTTTTEAPEEWALSLVDVPTMKCDDTVAYYSLQIEQPVDLRGGNESLYIISFFRTSPLPVKIGLLLRDADGVDIFEYHVVELEDLSKEANANDRSRRVSSAGDFAGSNCEDFFLSDGRTPVELPDTWYEAREAFRGMCETETGDLDQCRAVEEKAFNGYPRDEAAMDSDGALCTSLFKHGATFLPDMLQFPLQSRRLKGGGSFSNSRGVGAAGGRTFSSRSGGQHGYSTTSLSRNYPAANSRATGYGYAGRGGRAPYRTSTVTRSVVVGAVVFGGVGGFGFYRFGRHSSRCYGRSSTYRRRCQNETAAGNCSSEDPCDFELGDGEDLTRDDLLATTAFDLKKHPGPYTLEIRQVDGESFDPARICPPASWQGFNDTSWSPPDQQDLFVALTPVDAFVWKEDKSEGDGTALYVVLSLLGCGVLACCMYTLAKRHFQNQVLVQRRSRRVALYNQVQSRQGDQAAPIVKEVLDLSGNRTTQQDGVMPVKYKLSLLTDGTFSGVCFSMIGTAFQTQVDVMGVIDWQDQGRQRDNTIMWQEAPTQTEVEGRISCNAGAYDIYADLIDGDTTKKPLGRGDVELRGSSSGRVSGVALAAGMPASATVLGKVVLPGERTW